MTTDNIYQPIRTGWLRLEDGEKILVSWATWTQPIRLIPDNWYLGNHGWYRPGYRIEPYLFEDANWEVWSVEDPNAPDWVKEEGFDPRQMGIDWETHKIYVMFCEHYGLHLFYYPRPAKMGAFDPLTLPELFPDLLLDIDEI